MYLVIGDEMAMQPNVKGYRCAYCIRQCKQGIFCDLHSHMWDALCERAQMQITKECKEVKLKRKLQIYINRIVILDEVFKTGSKR